MKRKATIAAPAAALAAALGLFAIGSAQAAEPAAGTLSDPGSQVLWEGKRFVGAMTPAPEACVILECDEFRLTVQLPAGVWEHPGGVQIGIRWGKEGQDLDLHVYGPDGRLAAKSEGTYGFSAAQSVLLRQAANGVYRVVVVPVNGEDIGYRGLAEVERLPAVAPQRELRPNLVSLEPGNVRLATGAYFFEEGLGEAASCYPEETVEHGARRCLRFDQIVANVGAGPFEVRYRMDDPADAELRQRIYRSDGSFYDRRADTYELHPAHAHFHYRNFAQSHLWASNAEGDRLGQSPVRSGRKNGFCMIDVDNVWFGRKGDAAKAYNFPRCNAPTESDASGTYMTNGISVGWADVYNWFLADQYIEVSGLEDGYYLLETEADAAGTIVETHEQDNESWSLIRLRGNAAELAPEKSPAGSSVGKRPRPSAPGRT